MKYWPHSTIVNSPLLPPVYAHEIRSVLWQMPSEGAYYAMMDTARHTQPAAVDGLVFIESVRAPLRRMYTEYPSFDQWLRLERNGLYETDNGFMFYSVDALH